MFSRPVRKKKMFYQHALTISPVCHYHKRHKSGPLLCLNVSRWEKGILWVSRGGQNSAKGDRGNRNVKMTLLSVDLLFSNREQLQLVRAVHLTHWSRMSACCGFPLPDSIRKAQVVLVIGLWRAKTQIILPLRRCAIHIGTRGKLLNSVFRPQQVDFSYLIHVFTCLMCDVTIWIQLVKN